MAMKEGDDVQLNADCVRAVMLVLEHELTIIDNGNVLEQNRLSLEQICSRLPSFLNEDIFYAIYNLHQAGYLDVSIQWTSGRSVYACSVRDITYAGHEFLNRIRDEKRWERVKGAAGAVRDYSLSAISSIAEGITNAAIAAYFSKS